MLTVSHTTPCPVKPIVSRDDLIRQHADAAALAWRPGEAHLATVDLVKQVTE